MKNKILQSILSVFIFVLLTASVFAVDLTPVQPYANNNLVCSLPGATAKMYDYKWFKDGVQQAFTTETVAAGNAVHGQQWKCTMFTKPLPMRPAVNLGSATVTIQNALPIVSANGPYAGIEGATTINFIGTASDPIDNDAIASWSWDFGDGTPVDNNQNPTHIYAQNNTYTVTLTVTDSFGGVANATSAAVISDTVPVVNFSMPVSEIEGNSVAFTDLSTAYDMPMTWSWNFGDGSALDTAQNPGHIFAQNGTYNVQLTVTDADGSAVSLSQPIQINDTTPFANFTATNYTINEGDTVTFTDLSTAYDGVVAWNWDFGDGNTDTVQSPAHQYMANGTYNVTLTVTDADGSTNVSDAQVIVVNDLAPTANFSASDLNPVEGTPVVFTDLSTTPVDAIVAWNWDFGDGQTSVLQNPTNTYVQNGTYEVNLTVTDADGSVNSTIQTVVVNDTVPFANFTASSYLINEGEAINFTDLSTAYDGVIAWNWDFGDGATSTLQNDTHTYVQNGTYNVVLNATDGDGSVSSSAAQIIVVNDLSPFANFSMSNTTAMVNDTISFTDLSTAYDVPMTWSWDFGDGTPVDTAQNPTHAYQINGTFPVTLTVTDADGSVNSTSQNIVISSVPIVLDTTAPAAITGLTNGTITNESIAWTWTNPIDADFAGTIITLNGVNVANLTSVQNSYTALGLLNSTAYTIGVQTFDNATPANVNSTVVTDIQTTLQNIAALVHDVLISNTYIDNVNGVRLSDSLGNNVTGNLTIGQTYTIGYRTDNIGTAAESVTIYDTVYNSTGAVVYTNSHTHAIAIGANIADNTDSFNTAGLAAGAYTITVNASINGFADATPLDNIGTRTVNLVSAIIPDTTAPATITGLTNGTITNSSITWTWTNPVDADFANAIVYLDGNNVVNTTLGTYTASGLLNATSHTINVHTIDLSGNVNATDVTNTQTTLQNVPVIIPGINNIVTSWINGIFYPLNASNQVSSAAIDALSNISTSTITGLTSMTNSTIMNSVLTNSATVVNCVIIDTSYDGSCLNEYWDPSTKINSTTTGSHVTNSTVINSVATNSNIFESYLNSINANNAIFDHANVTNSNVYDSTVNNSNVNGGSSITGGSNVDGSTVTNSSVTNSDVTGSTVTNGAVVNGGSINNSNVNGGTLTNTDVTDSTLNNVTATNSDITNTTISNVVLDNANVTNGNLISGTITVNGTTYTINGTGNYTGIVPVAPVAIFSSSINAVANPQVGTFTSTSTDANNDIVSYAWTFSDGGSATGLVATHNYPLAGTYSVTLNVTDSTGLSSTTTQQVTITYAVITPPSSHSSGGGGGGGSKLSQITNNSVIIVGNTYNWNPAASDNTVVETIGDMDKVIFQYKGTSYSLSIKNITGAPGNERLTLGVSPTEEQRTGYKNDVYDFNIKDRKLLVEVQEFVYDRFHPGTRVQLKLTLTEPQNTATPITSIITPTVEKIKDGVIQVMGEVAPKETNVPVGIGISLATLAVGLLMFLGIRKIWQ